MHSIKYVIIPILTKCIQSSTSSFLFSQNAFNQVRHYFYSHKMHLIKYVIISIRIDPTVIFSIFQLFSLFLCSMTFNFWISAFILWKNASWFRHLLHPLPSHALYYHSLWTFYFLSPPLFQFPFQFSFYRFFSFLPTLSQKCFVSHWRNLYYRSWPLILVIRTFS